MAEDLTGVEFAYGMARSMLVEKQIKLGITDGDFSGADIEKPSSLSGCELAN